jgi:hypothetical protein
MHNKGLTDRKSVFAYVRNKGKFFESQSKEVIGNKYIHLIPKFVNWRFSRPCHDSRCLQFANCCMKCEWVSKAGAVWTMSQKDPWLGGYS